MASLKDLRMKIVSVKSTRKITSAMKMVAASKLRRAQTAAEAARPFAERMERMLGTLAASLAGQSGAPKMLTGTGADKVHLLVAVTADRGLCGGFNSSIVRATKAMAADLLKQGKIVKIMPVGRKAREQLRRDYGQYMIEGFENLGRKGVVFAEADQVAEKISTLFDAEDFDVCTVIYNRFKSAIAQEVTRQQVIPFPVPAQATKADAGAKAIYEFEPGEEEILADILPRNLATQVFRALLESQASEQGARMTAMDNATRNAGEMINALAIKYNRSRQAQITKELIEIISGAEAL
ncbi:F0F1 ATP synthase subunit gamma [Paramagnetospirillum marisnigri]|uniref:ATP synthase gamma chain n=1 Tax=Paramagnetospirillum marisnigri TaxID=1285242 RepID=A0A178MZL9_9PROT|nr:F0F1 ATP synthase subunit gamma [Paramagnetospirillum marisnigri]OAN55244.1 F0F1 ATP synthase subunit gamma [Paramagnetospirillum marisnigri]